MIYYVYIIICNDNYIYTGITNNIDKRLHEHSTGLNANTKNRIPIINIHVEEFTTRINAAKREKEIKGWRREKKLRLFNQ